MLSRPSLVAAGVLAVTLTEIAHAQAVRPLAPRARTPVAVAPLRIRLVVWSNGKPTVLGGLTNATGPGGAPLPTLAAIRAQAQVRQATRPPGIVLLQVQNGSPASQALAHVGSCKSPACAIEIDQLGANGEIVVSHRFSDGTSRTQYSTNELEEVSFTFGKIVVANLAAGTDSLSDVLTTSS